jgi:hypothetical protein
MTLMRSNVNPLIAKRTVLSLTKKLVMVVMLSIDSVTPFIDSLTIHLTPVYICALQCSTIHSLHTFTPLHSPCMWLPHAAVFL